MRQARILYKKTEAGTLTQNNDSSFTFRYDDSWINNASNPSISLTLPKAQQEFYSDHLFPFFYNMLPEGSNRQVVCKLNRIDLNDYFGLLLTTANNDTIGAISVVKLEH
ncbi:MAG: HipA N-terminal domain-containing protein [Marinirhabdus sp.]